VKTIRQVEHAVRQAMRACQTFSGHGEVYSSWCRRLHVCLVMVRAWRAWDMWEQIYYAHVSKESGMSPEYRTYLERQAAALCRPGRTDESEGSNS
jgi:hypothetical protein